MALLGLMRGNTSWGGWGEGRESCWTVKNRDERKEGNSYSEIGNSSEYTALGHYICKITEYMDVFKLDKPFWTQLLC